MSTLATIVCPVDFSDHSRAALARAYAWARHFRTRLVVVTVVEPLLANAADATYDMNFVRDEILPELRVFVEQVSTPAESKTPAEVIVLVGDPFAEIIAVARREKADLVIMATHGLTGYRKMLLGSTTEKVLRQTTIPVLVVPAADQTVTAMEDPMTVVRHVLAPVDFKGGTVTDVRVAAAIARTLDVPLLLLHVVRPVKGPERLKTQRDTHNRIQFERARQQIQRLISEAGESIAIETVVAVGSPAEEIAQIAVARDVGLIVMGLRTQEHMFGPRPGSIAYRVLGLAPAMVLALPPGETEVGGLRALVQR